MKWVEADLVLTISIIIIAVPAPTSVTLSSSIPNPIPPFGSNVTLTCMVELGPAVDVPVTVNTILTTPDGYMNTSTAQSVVGSTTNYTTTFMISSFGRSNSGLYMCGATATSTNAYVSDSSSTSTVSQPVRVTTGEIKVLILETCPYLKITDLFQEFILH